MMLLLLMMMLPVVLQRERRGAWLGVRPGRGELEAEALAGARRHEHQGVASRQHARRRRLLVLPEVAVAPAPQQGVPHGGVAAHHLSGVFARPTLSMGREVEIEAWSLQMEETISLAPVASG